MSIRNSTRVCALSLLVLITGCASHPDPIIDTKGVDMAKYEKDLTECRQYQDQVSVTEGAAKGAAVGAAVGAVVGAISGDAERGAGYGGVSGATQSGIQNQRTKEQVLKNCIRQRGYRVLN